MGRKRVNLINDPNYKKVKQELSSQLDQWMQNTNDPLLQGYVPKPAGARANIKSGLHPNEEEWEE